MQMDQLSQAINPVVRSGVLARSCRFKAGVCVLIAAGASMLFGCENAGQGAASGAAVGALSGLVIGSMSGNAGTGAAIGAVAGGAGGAVIGDQNRRNAQNAQAQANATAAQPQVIVVNAPTPPAPGLSPADRDRAALGKFARNWVVSGWETVNGERRFVSGTAVGSVENAFYMRLDMQVTDQLTGRINSGTVTLASEPGRGMTLNSRFNTSPSPVAYVGSVSPDGRVFSFNEVGSQLGRRMTINFFSDDGFTADVAELRGGSTVPSANFTFSALR